jgi:predicted house-cleaning noncanonical NTP pyrophosphatase (MazG superfamily)
MNDQVLFSEDVALLGLSDALQHKFKFGTKGAMLTVLPKAWTPPFALISASVFNGAKADGKALLSLGKNVLERVRLLGNENQLIVRSSVVGESIWDRGKYESINVSKDVVDFNEALVGAAGQVIASAQGKEIGLVVQRYIRPAARGEFGNLLRVSKTRDHWELSIDVPGGTTSRSRFNTQRDEAALPSAPLEIKRRITRERLFGTIAAWLNNYLLRGRSQRLTCEWIATYEHVYVVQIDEEDEDFVGTNPFQVRVLPTHRPVAGGGSFLRFAEGDALKVWDKLKVLEELWDPNANHKPMLFYVPVADLVDQKGGAGADCLARDFHSLIGPDSIVVRTSVRAGREKPPNLPRTEGVSPQFAAEWCLLKRDELLGQGEALADFAFVTHRFVPSRASAWARAEPENPVVEIHSLWGLPDGLQYSPYDIWEVHVPTEVATDYPDYKSNMLIASDSGTWEYVRIKNELARSLSVGQREALEIATRTRFIAQQLGKPCHVMWFVSCVDDKGEHFNIPWYWIEAHDTEKNIDRTNYKVFEVSDPESLEKFQNHPGSRLKQALELRPKTEQLMRDTKFICKVGASAKLAGVPVILQGSTLAHAYYQLRREGCTVVTPGEKEHSRVRRNIVFGKLVRDKIPLRIAQRQESESTWKLPAEVVKGFLIGKLIEEAMEVRSAETPDEKIVELADLYEVVRALIHSEGKSLTEVIEKADEKKEKAGGFDQSLVLLQTGILGARRPGFQEAERKSQVLARRDSGDTYEIPFSFFGFMEQDLPRSLFFEDAGVRLDVILKADKIQLRLSKNAEQLEFPLDMIVGPDEDIADAKA